MVKRMVILIAACCLSGCVLYMQYNDYNVLRNTAKVPDIPKAPVIAKGAPVEPQLLRHIEELRLYIKDITKQLLDK